MSDREITLKTPLAPDALLFVSLEGEDALSSPFAYELEMASEDPEVRAQDLLGQPVTVTVRRGEERRPFHGLVTDFGLRTVAEGLARYRATVRPKIWLLSLSTDNRIFQDMSAVEIVAAVLKEHGVAFELRLRRSYPPREYCVQYGESDLAFVSRLLEHEGVFWFFEHAEDDHLLVLADDVAGLSPAPGLDEVAFRDDGSTFVDGDFVVAWEGWQALATRRRAHTDYDFEKPSANLLAKSEGPEGFKGDASEAYEYPGDYRELARGDALAHIRLDAQRAPAARARARATAPGLRAGATFKLQGYVRAAENAEHLVLRARHRLWDGQYQTGLERRSLPDLGVGCEVALELQPAAHPYRPPRATPRPRMTGPQTAVVTGPKGEEIYTDKYARVKVQFHWDQEGRRDERTTCFVRVSAAWAGAGWGFIQIPRIGQEVVVDFLEGDPDRPLITGRVYNAEQMPPYALPANATQSGWKSNSSPGGGGFNELRFEDKKGAEEVYFQAEKDHVELVKNDESRHIGHDWKESVVHDATQNVGHDRRETVDHDKFTEVKNNRDVAIGVNDAERVGRDRSLHVGRDETIGVGGNSTEEIGRVHKQTVGLAQMILVKAGRTDKVGLVESRVVGSHQTITVGRKRSVRVGGKQNHHVQSDDATTVKGGQTLSVGKDQGVDVGAGQTLKVKADQGTDVGGARSVKVGKSQAHDVGDDISMSAGKKVTVVAGDTLTLTCGDATIELKKDGTITISGKDVKVVATGKVSAKADGDMLFKASKIDQN